MLYSYGLSKCIKYINEESIKISMNSKYYTHANKIIIDKKKFKFAKNTLLVAAK